MTFSEIIERGFERLNSYYASQAETAHQAEIGVRQDRIIGLETAYDLGKVSLTTTEAQNLEVFANQRDSVRVPSTTRTSIVSDRFGN